MKPKYITCQEYEMNEFYKQGYEYLNLIKEEYFSPSYPQSITGSVGDNPVNLTIPIGSTQIAGSTTKILMQLTRTSELLYGDKRENNT